MNQFQKEDSFHKIMKEHMLQTPSAQLEDMVMVQIKRHLVNRKVRINYLISFVFAVFGCIVGIASSIWIIEMKTIITELFGNYVFLASQTSLVLIVLILVDFVINSFLRYKNRIST